MLAGLNYYSPTAPAITSTPVTTGTVGEVYSYDVNASGYPYPTYSLTTPPAGMTIDAEYRGYKLDSNCFRRL